jgi:hypothetical protein
MKLTLEIQIGEDGQTDESVLARLATSLGHLEGYSPLTNDGAGLVSDVDGRTIGQWWLGDGLDSSVVKSPFENDSCCAGDTFHRSNCYRAQAHVPVLCSCGADLRAVPFVELQEHDSHGLASPGVRYSHGLASPGVRYRITLSSEPPTEG